MGLLDITSRGMLENIIERYIEAIPRLMPSYRSEGTRKMWMYDKAEDFVLGLTVGMIKAYFEGTIFAIYKRDLKSKKKLCQ